MKDRELDPEQSLETIKAHLNELREAIKRAEELKRRGDALCASFRAATTRAEIAKNFCRE